MHVTVQRSLVHCFNEEGKQIPPQRNHIIDKVTALKSIEMVGTCVNILQNF